MKKKIYHVVAFIVFWFLAALVCDWLYDVTKYQFLGNKYFVIIMACAVACVCAPIVATYITKKDN